MNSYFMFCFRKTNITGIEDPEKVPDLLIVYTENKYLRTTISIEKSTANPKFK